MRKIETKNQVDAAVEVPGSKSLTQRALIAAALADGQSVLHGPLASEDTAYTAGALEAFGIPVGMEPDRWLIKGGGGRIEVPANEIYLGNNGTATRFLTSVAALAHGTIRINGDERMAERPIQPLLTALAGWGADIVSIRGTGCPPLEIRAGGLAGGRTVLPAGKSSQYLSSLLLVGPYAGQTAELEVTGKVLSRPYIDMTLAVMAGFGIQVKAGPDYDRYRIPRGCYRALEYRIEGDASNASYFWAAAAITGGRVTVANVPARSLQGDAAFVDLLAGMGCRVEKGPEGVTVHAPRTLRAVEVDMGDMPDVAPTLAVVATRARGRTVIRNIGHLRIKECDRLRVVATGLNTLGVRVEEREDALIIDGAGGGEYELHGGVIDTHNDHRIAMSFAVAGLSIPGVCIENAGCVAKSFPDFWERFQRLYDHT